MQAVQETCVITVHIVKEVTDMVTEEEKERKEE